MDLHVTTRLPLLPLTCIVIILCHHSVTGQLKWADPIRPFITLAENTPVGTIVASNNLTGGDGLVVVSDNSNAKVNVTSRELHSVLFDVILNNALDYDYGPHVVQCTISGTNAAKDQHISLQIQILVTNTNDETPALKNQPYSVTVPENTRQNTVVYTHIVATDPDMNDVVNYSLSTTGEDVFAITDNGSLVVRGALDFETVRFYHYIVTATDKVGHNASADVFITVEDVQDTPPYFTGEPFQAKVSEDQKPGASILTIRAADGDRGVSNSITFKIINETCKGLFEIDPTSAVINLKCNANADRDTGDVYKNNGICTLEVQATEDKQHSQVGGIHTATTSVTVTILDVDDNVPVFSRPYYNVTVDENTQPGVPINLNTPITVSDADQSRNAEFEVHVISLQDYFEVTPSRYQSSGDILIRVKNSTILDYEAVELLTLGIEVRDTSGLSNSSYALVMVHINNINDNSPVFASYSYSFIVTENSAPGITLGKITATDADKDDGINGYGTIRYRLQGSDSGFKIDAFSGILTVDTTLDRETKSLYFLNVIAEDGGHFKTSALLEVTVADVNDEVPIFVTNEYYTSLKEGALSFSQPVTLHATDNDAPNTPNSEILYTINSTLPQGLESHFGLDRDSGALTVNKALWFEELSFVHEKVGNITLIVEAKDKGIPARSSSASVVVYLQNANNQNIICGQS